MTLSLARHALHRRRTERAMQAEVSFLKGVVTQRLNRAHEAIAERDEWIHDDQYRTALWETWRAARAHTDRPEERQG